MYEQSENHGIEDDVRRRPCGRVRRPGLGKCPMLTEGQVFYADYAKPAGLCDEAWKAIYQYVFALAHGASGLFYFGDWIRQPGVAVVSCNDGLRPVIFKLEATDLPAEIDYTPVR